MHLGADELTKIVLHYEDLEKCSRMRKRRKVEKLHRQFAHVSKEKLISLVRVCRVFYKDCDSCSVCLRFRRPPLQPVVGLTFGSLFNDIVYLNFKEHEHNQFWILHLIDTSTRNSAAWLVKTRKSVEFICTIFSMWISYFETSKWFLSDIGREFDNEGYHQRNEKLNIETYTTAEESPFSNGTVECHNLIVAEAMEKMLEDEKCEPEITLAWVVSAKMHLSNIVRVNLNASHAVKKNFIEAESSKKIQRVLRSKVRTYVNEGLMTRHSVYCRKQKHKVMGNEMSTDQTWKYIL